MAPSERFMRRDPAAGDALHQLIALSWGKGQHGDTAPWAPYEMEMDMKLTHLAAALSGGLMILSLSAMAGEKMGDMHDPMKMMDSNGDGMVSSSEHAAGAKAMFDKLDADRDGFVTATEMDAAHEGMDKRDGMEHEMSSADKIKAIDSDGDGKLSAAEHATGSQNMFARSDASGDGMVDAAEMKAAREAMMTKKDGN